MGADSSIAVKKLQVECQVPAPVGNQTKVKSRLIKIAKNQLAAALQECLKPLEQGGEQVVLIRSVQLDFDLDLLLSEGEIARLWADKIKSALLRELSSAKSSNIAVFENPAAYLATALLDLAQGRARSLWYYRAFDGLWALPVSAALRTALLDDRDRGLQALARLCDPELAEVCGALTEVDARRLMEALFAPREEPALPAAQAFTAALGEGYYLARGIEDKPAQQALLLAALVWRRQPALSASSLATCALGFAQLMRLQARYLDAFGDIVQALASGSLATLSKWMQAAEIGALTVTLPPAVARALAKPLLAAPMASAATEPSSGGHTHFGNALLLLPQIDRLPLQWASQWPECAGHGAGTVLRWLVLCACQGAQKFYAALQDPLLRDFCGIGPSLSLTDIVPWLNQQADAAELARLYTSLCEAAQRDGPVDGVITEQYHWSMPPRRIMARSENHKGRWLELIVEEDGAEDDGLTEGSEERGESVAPATRTLHAADFEALWLGRRFQLSVAARCALSALAQNALKAFAYRVPGFARSSVGYLWKNFLSMSATLTMDGERITAHLSKVPLSVMLAMTGVTRGRLQLPAFDARPIDLQESP